MNVDSQTFCFPKQYIGFTRIRYHSRTKFYQKISLSDFEFLINVLGPTIGKIDTNLRMAIPVQNRVALTLPFLAIGDSWISIQYLFKIS